MITRWSADQFKMGMIKHSVICLFATLRRNCPQYISKNISPPRCRGQCFNVTGRQYRAYGRFCRTLAVDSFEL